MENTFEKQIEVAIKANNSHELKSILQNTINPCLEFTAIGNLSPLKYAIKKGFINSITVLLEFGANPNSLLHGYEPPIHYLADTLDYGQPISTRIQILKLLLQYNADINIKDKSGCTILHLLVYRNRCCLDTFIKFVIKSGADINAINNDYKTPLYYACTNMNNFYLINMLIRKGADPNIKDNEGKSMIIHLLNRPQYIRFRNYYDPNSEDYYMDKASDYNVEDYLLKRNVNRSVKGDIEIPVKMLIEKGAYISRTPIADYSKTVANRLPDDILGIIQSYIEEDPLDVTIRKGFDNIAQMIADKRGIDLEKYKKNNMVKI